MTSKKEEKAQEQIGKVVEQGSALTEDYKVKNAITNDSSSKKEQEQIAKVVKNGSALTVEAKQSQHDSEDDSGSKDQNQKQGQSVRVGTGPTETSGVPSDGKTTSHSQEQIQDLVVNFPEPKTSPWLKIVLAVTVLVSVSVSVYFVYPKLGQSTSFSKSEGNTNITINVTNTPHTIIHNTPVFEVTNSNPLDRESTAEVKSGYLKLGKGIAYLSEVPNSQLKDRQVALAEAKKLAYARALQNIVEQCGLKITTKTNMVNFEVMDKITIEATANLEIKKAYSYHNEQEKSMEVVVVARKK